VLRPFTFSNGVTVPAGTVVSIPASSTHTDERIYSNPDEFDGFRFDKLRKIEPDTTTSRYQSVALSNEYLPFGVGRYAWYVFYPLFMISEPTRHYLLSVLDDSLRSLKSRHFLPILSWRMISSLRKGTMFHAGQPSLQCVHLRM
jgi:hypothetical protein